MPDAHPAPVVLDGGSLTLAQLVAVARDPRVRVELDGRAMERVAHTRALVDEVVAAYRAAYDADAAVLPMDYGITTGFGEFKRIPVHPDALDALQENILRSHAVGVGGESTTDDLSHHWPAEVVRAVLLLRANCFLAGHSGVRPVVVELIVAMLNQRVIPLVPLRGSLGASGDLCPLAHLFAVLLEEGHFYVLPEDGRTPADPVRIPASRLPDALGWPEVPRPVAKEGLALSNGATFSLASLALSLHDGLRLAQTADVACALSAEALSACARAFDARPHRARRQRGQQESAANLRALLSGSRSLDASGEVQDPYSVRCAPAVHGATRDVLSFVAGVVEDELNAATDNPLFFPPEVPLAPSRLGEAEPPPLFDRSFAANWPEGYDGSRRHAFSAGNFHGQPLALAADMAAIALAELASIAERRVQMLLDSNHNKNLPPNLAVRPGVESGLMIAQYTAAGLVSENKVLAHPASVDSIPSSANIEDHVSMSTIAARKLRTVLAHVQATLGIELVVAAQGAEWRLATGPDGGLRPHRAAAAEALPADASPRTRALAAEARAAEDARTFLDATGGPRPATDDPGLLAAWEIRALAAREHVAGRLGRGTGAAFQAVREVVDPLTHDRLLAPDLAAAAALVRSGELLRRVEHALGAPLSAFGEIEAL